MEKYLSIRVQTALYLSIFFISMHHVFVFITNSSNLRYIFGLKTTEVLSVYGLASIFGIIVYLSLLKIGIVNNIKRNIYIAAIIEIVCLILMYYFTINQNIHMFIGVFLIHHLMTPYIMFNLDALFESYTHIKDRGKSRGIYLTVWNIPFVVTPLIMSTLSVTKLPIVYLISSSLIIPFLYIIFYHIKNPSTENTFEKKSLSDFFADKLNRKAFAVQSFLHLYYGFTAVMLPIYLRSNFLFDWDKIGLILAAMTAPFVLIQIPFGNMEDKKHNEKKIFKSGLFITILFSIFVLLINPNIDQNTAFILFCVFLFSSHAGCSLIEISTESIFYKHINDRDYTAMLMFRVARILPYSLGALALLFL